MLKKLSLAGMALAALLTLGGTAEATAITQGGGFTVTWDVAVAGHPDLTASAVFSNFNYIASNKVQFNLNVTNTTSNTGFGKYGDDRLTSFGWDTNPNTTGVTDTTGVFLSTTSGSISGTHLDVCFYSGSNCNGGGNGGLESADLIGLHGDPSTTGNFLVTLTFDARVPPLDFSTFIAKFQTDCGSFEDTGTVTTSRSVPEPLGMALLGSGLLGLGWLRRRPLPV